MPAIEMTRKDLNVSQLRAAARTADAKQARRILAIAMGLDGSSRRLAAPRQTSTGRRRVSALLILDGAGWPSLPRPVVPENIALLPLRPSAPPPRRS
ncbi:MAG: hypothetical protein M3178_03445 [Pseudomonadota bacterium]|nr:hypothetical protein [Pseudomonadota bacterium]